MVLFENWGSLTEATASRVFRLSASSTIFIEASWLKLFGASESPRMLLSAELAAELSLVAVSGKTVADAVYTVILVFPNKKKIIPNAKATPATRNLYFPNLKNILFSKTCVVTK